MDAALNAQGAAESELRELMTRYQAGSMEAFEELYGSLSPGLLGFLGSLARDSARATDLLQETFLRIHRSRHTYSPALPLRPWAYAIARHVYLMDTRARRRRGVHEAPAEMELPEMPVPPEVESLASRAELGRALGRLSTDRREALLLHHLLGLSFREVAAMLGIREGAAKLRASRGMADLRAVLRETQPGGARA